jgi:hypothetical protein
VRLTKVPEQARGRLWWLLLASVRCSLVPRRDVHKPGFPYSSPYGIDFYRFLMDGHSLESLNFEQLNCVLSDTKRLNFTLAISLCPPIRPLQRQQSL